METFRPSVGFVDRTMYNIRSYEQSRNRRMKRIQTFLQSRPGVCLLSAAGILMGILNLMGMAWMLLSPDTCL
jgi:hypothetical protein